jgi:hypothetical protein
MPEKSSRAERLATKLRENLHRRKAQARELKAEGDDSPAPLPNPPADR